MLLFNLESQKEETLTQIYRRMNVFCALAVIFLWDLAVCARDSKVTNEEMNWSVQGGSNMTGTDLKKKQ
jgi:hypothetical protein